MNTDDFDLDQETVQSWQQLVDAMAEAFEVPAGLIMKIRDQDIEVFLASRTEKNPYRPGAQEPWIGSGLYCETVINTRKHLLVPDATADEEWRNNPDIKLNMISYLGFPIFTPTGDVFGTICVLDQRANAYSQRYVHLMEQYALHLENDLKIVDLNRKLESRNQQLERALDEVHLLRGFIPICAQCKSIRDDEGYWRSIEHYLAMHPDAVVGQDICPACAKPVTKG